MKTRTDFTKILLITDFPSPYLKNETRLFYYPTWHIYGFVTILHPSTALITEYPNTLGSWKMPLWLFLYLKTPDYSNLWTFSLVLNLILKGFLKLFVKFKKNWVVQYYLLNATYENVTPELGVYLCFYYRIPLLNVHTSHDVLQS